VSRRWLTALGTGVAMLVLTWALLNTQLASLTERPNPPTPIVPYLLAWRVLLYAGIATLWWQVDQMQATPAARSQWRRLGGVCGLLILAVEFTRIGQA